MNDIVQVSVYGDAAPESYEDFSAMLESSLATVSKRSYVVMINVESEELLKFTLQYCNDRQLAYRFAMNGIEPYPAIACVAFLKFTSAKSFDVGPTVNLLSRPTIFLI